MNVAIRNMLVITTIIASLIFVAQRTEAQQNDSAQLIAIIDAIEKGWEQGDGQPFRDHYLDFTGARYIEGGGQNEGLADLVGHHVEPEGDALADFELNLTNIETHLEGDFAWAVVDVEVKALVKSEQRQIHNRGYETFLFRRVADEWKVVHTHSSSRPVTKEASREHSEEHD